MYKNIGLNKSISKKLTHIVSLHKVIEKPKIIIGIILALILAFSLTGISYYFPTNQNETIIIPNLPLDENNGNKTTYTMGVAVIIPNVTITVEGDIEPQNAPIQKIGKTYILTDDIINNTLRIELDNIVIDGQGHKIQSVINAPEGILLYNRNNVTLLNMEISQFWTGITLKNCSMVTITENSISSIGSRAIIIESSNNTIITDNDIEAGGTGISFDRALGVSNPINCTIARNSIINAAQGISAICSFSTITENCIANVYIQIGIRGNHTVISKNYLTNGIDGIMTTGSNCTIHQNNIVNFSESGITINRGTNCNIFENSISNSERGIILRNHEDAWVIENNTFHNNNFINNTQNVNVDFPSHSNMWNNGSEGNYWSDYNGTDSNGDGIGDTPYVIDENNIDYFPLMSQHYIEDERNMLYVYLGIAGLVSFVLIVIAIMFVNKRKK